MKNITIRILRMKRDTVLTFLASLSLYLVLDRTSQLLLSHLKLNLLKSINIIIVNYLITAVYLLLITIVVFLFYLIGRSVDLKRRFLSSILSLILGSYIGSLIQVLITYGGPLTLDMIIIAFLNIFVLKYFFFIAFTGMAIGYIKAKQ